MSLFHIQTDMLTLFTEILCISLAVLFGILAYSHLGSFLRLLVLQVIIWSFFYTGSYLITWYQVWNNKPIDNQWFMNIHMLVETGLLLIASRFALPKTLRTWIPVGAFSLFLSVLLFQVWKQGFGVYLNYADVTACILLTWVFSLVLYRFGRQENTAAEKWACLGILLYVACSVPYVSLMHYLQHKNPAVNTFLYYLISGVLANIRYLTLALACWMVYRAAKNKIQTNE